MSESKPVTIWGILALFVMGILAIFVVGFGVGVIVETLAAGVKLGFYVGEKALELWRQML